MIEVKVRCGALGSRDRGVTGRLARALPVQHDATAVSQHQLTRSLSMYMFDIQQVVFDD